MDFSTLLLRYSLSLSHTHICSLSLSLYFGLYHQWHPISRRHIKGIKRITRIKRKSSLTISESPNPWSLHSPQCASSHLYCLPVSPMLFGSPDEIINPQGENCAPLFWQLSLVPPLSQSPPGLAPPQSCPYPSEMFTVFPELFLWSLWGVQRDLNN